MGVVSIWVDDVRDPAEHGRVGWIWAKSAKEAIDAIEGFRKCLIVDRISLDHDLCPQSSTGQTPTAPTGLDVALWMEENEAWPARGVYCHSANEYGKAAIEAVLRRNGQLAGSDVSQNVDEG